MNDLQVLPHQLFVSLDGGGVRSGGGTPHSGKSFGRWILLGSQSLSAAALNRFKQKVVHSACLSGTRKKRLWLWYTDEVFFPDVKIPLVLVQT
jgi:hypothetical protein